jgi:hypothetical protein
MTRLAAASCPSRLPLNCPSPMWFDVRDSVAIGGKVDMGADTAERLARAVEVQSKEGEGLRFTVRLPRAALTVDKLTSAPAPVMADA